MTEDRVDGSGSIPIDDTDISTMEPQAAREYVLAFIKSLKETQSQKERLTADLYLWRNRVSLAESHNRAELAEEARRKVEELRDEVAKLDAEEESLREKVVVLKTNLKALEVQFSYSVDAEMLLAELDMITGKPDELAEEFEKMKAEAHLEALKKKLEEEQQ